MRSDAVRDALAPTADPRRVLDAAWAPGWRPRPRIALDEWADRNRYMADKAGASSGRWRTLKTPYLREPMRCFTDPRIRTITWMCSSQVGKTETWLNALLYTIDQLPMPTLIVMPDEKQAKSLNKDRVLPTIEASPCAAAHLTGQRGDEKNLQINLDNMTVWYGWSNSNASLKAKAIGLLILDEIDEYKKGAKGKAKKRTQTFPNCKIFQVSTPTEEDAGIHEEYERGDKRTYWVPCPHCGAFQRLRWAQVKWGAEGSIPGRSVDLHPAAAQRTAYYECEKCLGAIEDHHKPELLKRGAWAADGRSVVAGENGEATLRGPEPVRSDHASFHISALYSPFVSFGELAKEWVELRGEPDREFINERLGEPWRKAGMRGEAENLIACARACTPEYFVGMAPPGTLMLTGAIDVQSDRAYYEVVGWGWSGVEFPILIDFGVVECPEVPGADFTRAAAGSLRGTGRGTLGGGWFERLEREALESFAELAPLLDKEYPLAMLRPDATLGAPLGADQKPRTIGVHTWAIDAGYRTSQVFMLARSMWPRLQPVVGRTREGQAGSTAAPLTEGKIDRLPDGKPLPGGVTLLRINTDFWKEQVFARMWRPAGLAGAPLWPRDLPERYALQMTAEERAIKVSKSGASASEWRKRPGRNDNHWWDCRVYNTALFEHKLRRIVRAMGERGAEPGRQPERRRPTRMGL